MSHAPPPGPPPGHPPRPPQRQESLDDAIPEDAPPAYEAVSSDPVVQHGPSHMDFSGPPPLPDRLQQAHTGSLHPTPSGGSPIPGVGIGYGGANSPNPGQGVWRPPPPPQHRPLSPQQTGMSQNPPPPPSQPQDRTPTTVPTPGRPLLYNNKLLVYPRNHRCQKCQNTGYKKFDPSNPCSSDWRKWGKPFTGALAHSYSSATDTTAATNFQQPLPLQRPPQQQQRPAMGHYPGQYPQQYPQQQYQPPQSRPQIITGYGYGRPPGAVVYRPGDPRIGGQACRNCYGTGLVSPFFLFEETCPSCGGIGRVF